MMLNILNCTGQIITTKTIWPQMSIMLKETLMWISGFQNVVPRPAASGSAGNLLTMYTLKVSPWASYSEWAQHLYFKKHSRGFWYMLKFKSHWNGYFSLLLFSSLLKRCEFLLSIQPFTLTKVWSQDPSQQFLLPQETSCLVASL